MENSSMPSRVVSLCHCIPQSRISLCCIFNVIPNARAREGVLVCKRNQSDVNVLLDVLPYPFETKNIT